MGMLDETDTKVDALLRHNTSTQNISGEPYSALHYLNRALAYQDLGYPDLAAADAYKALLLVDEISDESGEYHDQACTAFESSGLDLKSLQKSVYKVLIQSLVDCKCFRSSFTFAKQWQRIVEKSDVQPPTSLEILETYKKSSGHAADEITSDPDQLPDLTVVRREIYPWNDQEPKRNSVAYISILNEQLKDVAPKCEVRVAEYPILTGNSGTTKQLGLFAKKDINAGEVVLNERSLLTANNNLHDTLCDACSSELPRLGEDNELFSCSECDDTIFCSQVCLDAAMESYHPAVCGKDIDSIARDTDSSEASDALYFLILARTIAMAETQDVHPLQLKEISSLWGDFAVVSAEPSEAKPSLPFSFAYNVLYPIHLLTQMDIDIYATTPRYDFWVINTLYAKFRGVASGRPNRRTGKPEVCAVHPLWCLAHHSCAPNVTWEWSADIKLVSRQGEQVVKWGPNKDKEDSWKGDIREGDEILNHYCDVQIGVDQRREWARGPLGGDCMCERCLWEEKHKPVDITDLKIK